MTMNYCKVCKRYVDTEHRDKGPHLGEYCSICGSWLRWVPCQERQKIVHDELDKIEKLRTKISNHLITLEYLPEYTGDIIEFIFGD